MTEVELSRRIARHNRFNLLVGILLLPAAALLWYVTFRLLVRLFAWPSDIFLDEWFYGFPDPSYAIWLAWITIGLLVIDMLWRLGAAMRLGHCSDVDYFDSSVRFGQTTLSYTRRFGDRTGPFFLLYLFFTCAPRATAVAAEFLFDRIRARPAAVAQAARVLGTLERAKKWLPTEEFEGVPEGVRLLARMNWVWFREHDERLEIRVPPSGEE